MQNPSFLVTSNVQHMVKPSGQMANVQCAPKSCHNCRRQRWKCDRSLPGCRKCAVKGQQCLGYQHLLRWESGVASRGKMMGRSFQQPVIETMCAGAAVQRCEAMSPRCPTDPFFQDLDQVSMQYMHHCKLRFAVSTKRNLLNHTLVASYVCRDLVLYDVPGHNPFYELLPMAHHHPVILQAIVAISAMHKHNKIEAADLLISNDMKSQLFPQSVRTGLRGDRSIQMVDALTAKQRTLNLLRTSIETDSASSDIILTVVLLLIELELLDSGHGHWRRHLKGASDALKSLRRVKKDSSQMENSLCSTVAANCIMQVYRYS